MEFPGRGGRKLKSNLQWPKLLEMDHLSENAVAFSI